MSKTKSIPKGDGTVLHASGPSVSDSGGLPKFDVKKLGSLPASIENRKQSLTRFIVPKAGGGVSEDVKLEAVNVLVESAKGSLKQRVRDLEYLGKLGVTFEPIVRISGPKTAMQANKIWGIRHKKITDCLADSDTRVKWGATRKEGKNKNRPWIIPEETVNRVNVELKTAVSLKTLYDLLKDNGVNMNYHTFKKLFVEPDMMRDTGRALLKAKMGGGDERKNNLLVNTLYSKYKDQTDVTSAAGVARFLLDEKRRVKEGLSSKQVGRILDIGWAQVHKLIRAGKIPGVVVVGMTTGQLQVRLTAAEAAEAFISLIDTSSIPPKYVLEYPEGWNKRKKVMAKMLVERKTMGYVGLGDVPDAIKNELTEFGIIIRKETDEELRRRAVVDTLLKRFGTIQCIAENVPEAVLTELNLKITKEHNEWHMRRIKPGRK